VSGFSLIVHSCVIYAQSVIEGKINIMYLDCFVSFW